MRPTFRPILARVALLALPLLLCACASPPKPPSVDESLKRPANNAMSVELQVCRGELQNTRIRADESGHLADTAAAILEQVTARQRMVDALQPDPATLPVPANDVFMARFESGSTRVNLPDDVARELIVKARAAPLVLLRGRTDGDVESFAESRVARERAASVRDYLVVAGVDPMRIRMTWQPVGDPIADNASAQGRSMNRRVEVEVYRARPVAVNSGVPAAP